MKHKPKKKPRANARKLLRDLLTPRIQHGSRMTEAELRAAKFLGVKIEHSED